VSIKGQVVNLFCRLFLFLTLFLAWSVSFADWESALFPGDFQTENSLLKAASSAEKVGKHVIVYATRRNCPPCDALKSLLRIDTVAKPYRDAYVFTAVWTSSMGSTEREDYRQRYGVQGAPTWLVFTNAGKYVCTARNGVFETEEQSTRLHQAIQMRLVNTTDGSSTSPRKCI
jgi:thioredoxin-related protein